LVNSKAQINRDFESVKIPEMLQYLGDFQEIALVEQCGRYDTQILDSKKKQNQVQNFGAH
jgi:hypothetical protein